MKGMNTLRSSSFILLSIDLQMEIIGSMMKMIIEKQTNTKISIFRFRLNFHSLLYGMLLK